MAPFKSLIKREFDTRCVLNALANLSSWALAVAVSVYYTLREPHDNDSSTGKRIWDQNFLHPTGFTMDPHVVIAFWIGLFITQFCFIVLNTIRNARDEKCGAIVTHFAVNNLFHVLFLLLFVRSVFRWAEFVLLLNFVNLTCLYFFHHNSPHFIHAPLLSGPLAWTFIAIYWNGLVAIPAEGRARDVLTILSIWGIMAYGIFFLAAYKDCYMPVFLGFLTAGIAIAQLSLEHEAYIWISSVIVAAILMITTLIFITLQFWEKTKRCSMEGNEIMKV